MKKEIIFLLIIIILIIIMHAVSQIYTQNFFDEISDDINSIEDKIINDDIQNSNLKDSIEKILDKWDSKYKLFACYIEHDELEKVKTQLISIRACIIVEDYKKTVDEIEVCKFVLKHIEDKDSLKILNIF